MDPAHRARLVEDFERFSGGLPPDIAAHARERHGVDLTGEYAGRRVRIPIGKASGQLSMTRKQVEADAEAGVGFVVLKTVIAQDEDGARAMGAWAVHESQMAVEKIVSRTGRQGWTVTWAGRGWDRSFPEYESLYRDALDIGFNAGMPVAASVKYHLPRGDEPFRAAEYAFTTQRLAGIGADSTIIEKDFSPTLAGDGRANDQATILRWLREVPALIRGGARTELTLGIKIMNALFDDDFQVAMVQAAALAQPDYLVCFNRLFDPVKGYAFGGWDLSDRNLRVLDAVAAREPPDRQTARPRICGTGNIISGRMLVEYALRGARAGQCHTFFQLPAEAYAARLASRSASAIHSLIYHPDDGLIAALHGLADDDVLMPRRDGLLHFLDLPSAARSPA